MKLQSLNGAWRLRIPGSAFPETAARVPGSVYYGSLTFRQSCWPATGSGSAATDWTPWRPSR